MKMDERGAGARGGDRVVGDFLGRVREVRIQLARRVAIDGGL
jgi:hypothetical protein